MKFVGLLISTCTCTCNIEGSGSMIYMYLSGWITGSIALLSHWWDTLTVHVKGMATCPHCNIDENFDGNVCLYQNG